jgi:hypothetical protein
VVDHDIAAGAKQLLEALAPGPAPRRDEVERDRAAKQGDHDLAGKLSGRALEPAQALRIDEDPRPGLLGPGRQWGSL